MKTHSVIILNARELGTVLAALRFLQLRQPIKGHGPEAEAIEQIATDGGTVTALSPLEIDGLCQRLNTEGRPAPSPADKITTLHTVEPAAPVIIPVKRSGDYRSGELVGITRAQIEAKLGKPNVKDDPNKVRWSWGFTVNGVRCGVWDWKGSGDVDEWSTFGPFESLRLVFGEHAIG